MRIGIGYDVHRFEEGRPLILGGLSIPCDKGLAGHSDADVLVHAVMDALLGAAGLGDIGRHFPDSDIKYKNISSMTLLSQVCEKIASKGYMVINVDSVIIAQKPKLAPYLDEMSRNLSAVLSADVNVKATTEEGLGFTGREEGIAAKAVCLLSSAY